MLLFLSLILLLAALYGGYRHRENILHPAFWTSLGFLGYSIGGIYYFAFGYENANFLNLAGIDLSDRGEWFLIAMTTVLCGFFVCSLGFHFGDRYAQRYLEPGSVNIVGRSFPSMLHIWGGLAAIVLTILGVLYWVYFARQIAGGVISMFQNVAAYRYLAADAGMSAIPFHLAYGGALLWMLICLDTKRNHPVALIFLPVGAVMILSTGRIALANGFAFSGIIAYYFALKGCVNWKVFAGALFLLLPFNVVFYFFRVYTSYAYIGKAEEFVLLEVGRDVDVETASALFYKFKYVLKALIGGGNVPDLQQIILIFHGLFEGRLHLEFGSTYFDWLRNLSGVRIGAPNEGVQSVGYRILAAYFPQKTGGPTPGMMGEAILNFGFLAPLAIFAFCFLMAIVFARASRSQSLLVKLLYCQFLIGIWALFLKVDSSLLLGYLWAAGPISLCWFGLHVLARLRERMLRAT
ncbi:hypothetical protein [Rhizobium rosettiformans]|uniref:hypothetical protein n=1 Tax=Rhizobium rosettiformans TaxID=1368430 RepID=UPI002856B7AE|nr:hypothetical protein [Rhizobium rosettiformans]MDR7028997.1 hypothetical protein [Rhizobium rosettiformans]MDR7063721.1 hypothetical protein [Rhizobium rosettiformans]